MPKPNEDLIDSMYVKCNTFLKIEVGINPSVDELNKLTGANSHCHQFFSANFFNKKHSLSQNISFYEGFSGKNINDIKNKFSLRNDEMHKKKNDMNPIIWDGIAFHIFSSLYSRPIFLNSLPTLHIINEDQESIENRNILKKFIENNKKIFDKKGIIFVKQRINRANKAFFDNFEKYNGKDYIKESIS
mgnify:CR=1 FL=1|tara:strand:- start:237 stop:800 length:564 start_codon:yes stop_codon:yes gene_type:complete